MANPRFLIQLIPLPHEVLHKSTQRQVNIKVLKKEEVWWSRLTRQEKKPLFLAPDFDRWQDESDAEKELHEKVERLKTHLLRVHLETIHGLLVPPHFLPYCMLYVLAVKNCTWHHTASYPSYLCCVQGMG